MTRSLPRGLLLLALVAAPAQAGSRDPGTTTKKNTGKRPKTTGILGVLRPPVIDYRVRSVHGKLTAAVVRAALAKQRKRLEACVARDKKLVGRVVLSLHVGASKQGTVMQRRSTLKSAVAEACLRRVVAGMPLDRPGRVELAIHVRQGSAPGSLFGTGVGGGAGGLGLRGSGGGRVQGAGGTGSTHGPVIGQGGPLSRGVIRRVIRSHLGQVQHCYEKQLVTQPALTGRLVVRLTIGPDGKVRSARVTADSLQDPVVGRCVVRRVLTWVFPRPRGGGIVNVNYPFVFRTTNASPNASPPK